MPVNPNAAIEITAFRWVPPFAEGLVRDLRARWVLEEAGLDYRVRLLEQQRPPEYLREQPFDQVPCFNDGKVHIFESGAIVQYVGEKSEALLPREPQGRYRAIQWTYAALNSVEPAIQNLASIDLFDADQEWAKLRRPGAVDFVRLKLKRVSDWLGDKHWLERPLHHRRPVDGRQCLRILRHTDLVAEFPNLAAYVKRGEARPAFKQALSDQTGGVQPPIKWKEQQHDLKDFRRNLRKHVEAGGRRQGKLTLRRGRMHAGRWMPPANIRRQARDAANEKMRATPMKEMGATMPFDGKRMIWAASTRSSRKAAAAVTPTASSCRSEGKSDDQPPENGQGCDPRIEAL